MVRIALSATVMLMAGVSGCMTSPSVVANKPGVGGVVAVPSNSNSWPNYNHDEAIKKIKKLYPNPNFDQRTDLVEAMYVPNRGFRLVSNTSKPLSPEIAAMLNTKSDKEEYRIAYVVKQQPITNTSLNRGGGGPIPELQRVNGQIQPVPPPVGGNALSPNAQVTPASFNTPATNDPLLRGAFPPSSGMSTPPTPPSSGLPSSPAAGVGYSGMR